MLILNNSTSLNIYDKYNNKKCKSTYKACDSLIKNIINKDEIYNCVSINLIITDNIDEYLLKNKYILNNKEIKKDKEFIIQYNEKDNLDIILEVKNESSITLILESIAFNIIYFLEEYKFNKIKIRENLYKNYDNIVKRNFELWRVFRTNQLTELCMYEYRKDIKIQSNSVDLINIELYLEDEEEQLKEMIETSEDIKIPSLFMELLGKFSCWSKIYNEEINECKLIDILEKLNKDNILVIYYAFNNNNPDEVLRKLDGLNNIIEMTITKTSDII